MYPFPGCYATAVSLFLAIIRVINAFSNYPAKIEARSRNFFASRFIFVKTVAKFSDVCFIFIKSLI